MEDNDLLFDSEEAPLKQDPEELGPSWGILVVDDDDDIHRLTRMILDGLRYKGRRLELTSVYSAAQARELLKRDQSFAVVIIDVVMESDSAGLDLVNWIRNDLGAFQMRMILRTGVPGMAPKRTVIQKYDINDYLEKTEVTSSRLFASIITALRTYEDFNRFHNIFENTRIAIWELDMNPLMAYLEELHETEIRDLNDLLKSDPSFIGTCAGLVKTNYKNPAAKNLEQSLAEETDPSAIQKLLEGKLSAAFAQLLPHLWLGECRYETRAQVTIFEGGVRHFDLRWSPPPNAGHDFSNVLLSLLDVASAEVEQRLDLEKQVSKRGEQVQACHAELLEKAHQAGMADLASSVIHNMGNILNSIFTSCHLLDGLLDNSRLSSLSKITELLGQNRNRLADFFDEPKGQMLLDHLFQTESRLLSERESAAEQVQRLTKNARLARDVLNAQQNFAAVDCLVEATTTEEIVERAILVQAQFLEQNGVKLNLNLGDSCRVMVQKSKLIFVLSHLLKNAGEALMDNTLDGRRITVSTSKNETFGQIIVKDWGCGILQADQERIFNCGFSTKRDSHGFGLHACANAMREMKGGIQVFSEGAGQGATFTLRLPLDMP